MRTAEAVERQKAYRLNLIAKLERQLADQRAFHAMREELSNDGENLEAWWLSAKDLRAMIAQRERAARREARASSVA